MNTAIVAEPLAKSGEAVKAGPIGLAVILLLCIACYFLFKSMSKHMRTVRENFPADPPPPPRPSTTERKADTATSLPRAEPVARTPLDQPADDPAE